MRALPNASLPDVHLAAQPTRPPHCSLQLRLTKIEDGSTATPNSPGLAAVLKRLQVRGACCSAGVWAACSAGSVSSHLGKQSNQQPRCRARLSGMCWRLLHSSRLLLQPGLPEWWCVEQWYALPTLTGCAGLPAARDPEGG